jgi:hypothetical protein
MPGPIRSFNLANSVAMVAAQARLKAIDAAAPNGGADSSSSPEPFT